MTGSHIESRLAALGLVLPKNPPLPAGKYEPFRLHDGTAYLAAQTSGYDDPSLLGRVGIELTLADGIRAAERAALNSLAAIRNALGGFERFHGLLHVAGHVASADDFLDQPEVLDGASSLFLSVLGESGKHTRTAYPHLRLPKNICIELEVTFAYER